MKKALTILGLIVLGFAPHVFAEGFVPLAPIPGLTDNATVGSVIGPDTLANFFNNLYKYLIGVAATLAVIEIIWGGLLYSTTDSVGNKEEGKEKIRMAIFGLVLVLSPALVFSIINPSILNLSLNLPPIKLTTTPAQQAAPDNSVPPGATVIPFGAAVPVGKWCYNATPRTQSYGQTAPFCFADEDGCVSALNKAKAANDGTVNDRTVCFKQQ